MKSWLLLLRPESQAARLWLYSEKQTGSVLGREGETRICFLRNILQVITVCKRSKIFKFILNVNLHYTPMLASWLLHHPRWQPPRSFSEVSWPHHHSFHVDIIGFNVSHLVVIASSWVTTSEVILRGQPPRSVDPTIILSMLTSLVLVCHTSLLHHPGWQPPRSASEVSGPHHHSFHVDIIGFNVSHFIIHQLFHPPPQVPHDVLHNVQQQPHTCPIVYPNIKY